MLRRNTDTLIPRKALPTLGLQPGSPTDASQRWFARAKKALAGGISSSARATTSGDFAYPLYIAHGQGSRIWDADGNEFIDYLLGYGSLDPGPRERGHGRRR